MKVKLRGNTFLQYDGAVVEARPDATGAVKLPNYITQDTTRKWAFREEYEVVCSNDCNKKEMTYTVTVELGNANDLVEMLDSLPTYILESATVYNNGGK